MKQRYSYAIIILSVILTGLWSRSIEAIPAATGDLLYAVMMYFIVRFFLIKRSIVIVALIGLCICFAIEFSQLYQSSFMNAIRATLPGRLLLGQGFLRSDLLAYVAGVLTAGVTDAWLRHNKKNGQNV